MNLIKGDGSVIGSMKTTLILLQMNPTQTWGWIKNNNELCCK